MNFSWSGHFGKNSDFFKYVTFEPHCIRQTWTLRTAFDTRTATVFSSLEPRSCWPAPLIVPGNAENSLTVLSLCLRQNLLESRINEIEHAVSAKIKRFTAFRNLRDVSRPRRYIAQSNNVGDVATWIECCAGLRLWYSPQSSQSTETPSYHGMEWHCKKIVNINQL